jgi:hypothetical protein
VVNAEGRGSLLAPSSPAEYLQDRNSSTKLSTHFKEDYIMTMREQFRCMYCSSDGETNECAF